MNINMNMNIYHKYISFPYLNCIIPTTRNKKTGIPIHINHISYAIFMFNLIFCCFNLILLLLLLLLFQLIILYHINIPTLALNKSPLLRIWRCYSICNSFLNYQIKLNIPSQNYVPQPYCYHLTKSNSKLYDQYLFFINYS